VCTKNGDLISNVVLAGLIQNNECAQRCIDDSFLFAEVLERYNALRGSRVLGAIRLMISQEEEDGLERPKVPFDEECLVNGTSNILEKTEIWSTGRNVKRLGAGPGF